MANFKVYCNAYLVESSDFFGLLVSCFSTLSPYTIITLNFHSDFDTSDDIEHSVRSDDMEDEVDGDDVVGDDGEDDIDDDDDVGDDGEDDIDGDKRGRKIDPLLHVYNQRAINQSSFFTKQRINHPHTLQQILYKPFVQIQNTKLTNRNTTNQLINQSEQFLRKEIRLTAHFVNYVCKMRDMTQILKEKPNTNDG